MRVSPGARIGPYEVVGLIGAGGMGEVYRGRDTRLQRPVAIKVITPDVADPGMVRRFESEALAASALNHPNILTVHEFGVHDGLHYLVTEFIEGETLRQRLQRGALPLADALEIALQIGSALDAAHAAGLIHRDVKPENVMLRPDGYVKVLDFGLAKLSPISSASAENVTVSVRTEPGMILGTLGYMPPEQVRGLHVDQRADIWSLGVVLHEMISGRSPFAGPTTSDVIAGVLERQPPPLSGGGAEVPAELERIVGRTLAKDRDERYPSIKELQTDLRRVKHSVDRLHRSSGAVALDTRSRRRTPLRRWGPLAAATIALIAAVVAASVWPPRRTVDYWLTVQKMRDGKPYQSAFESSGQEIFENGWKFRLNLQSPLAGFLYLLNEGPDAKGTPTLRMLYPTPSNPQESAVPAGQIVQSNWYVFDENQGAELFWIVWSTRKIPELERATRWVNEVDLGTVKDPQEAATIQRLLEAHASGVNVSKDTATGRSVIDGRGELLARRVDLEHR